MVLSPNIVLGGFVIRVYPQSAAILEFSKLSLKSDFVSSIIVSNEVKLK